MTPAELVALVQPAFRDPAMRSLQAISNLELTPLGPDEAALGSALVGHHHRPGTAGGDDVTLFARYHDRARRTDAGWRLVAVRLEVLFVRGNLAILG